MSHACSLTDHAVVLRSLSQCHKCPRPHINHVLTAGFPVTVAPYVGFLRHHVPAFILNPWLPMAVCQAYNYQSTAASMAATSLRAVGTPCTAEAGASLEPVDAGFVIAAISYSAIKFSAFQSTLLLQQASRELQAVVYVQISKAWQVCRVTELLALSLVHVQPFKSGYILCFRCIVYDTFGNSRHSI